MMSTVRELHDKAMHLAQLALLARQQGKLEEAKDLARQACVLETKAADMIPEDEDSEPTRSILYQSAASLDHLSQEAGPIRVDGSAATEPAEPTEEE
jgi:hypothetical protein